MRYSQMLIPTLRDAPSDAEVVSHKLMLRAGMIRQLARGIYDYLPLGLRVLRKIEKIVREELDRAGCQEVLLPVIIPAELWQETGRWNFYGKELLRLKDRNERDFCFGPTQEEIITDLVRREIRSYRELPKNFYQIHTKFRDEIRPRFGLMRAREFIMKDGYSFHATQTNLDEHYELMRRTYVRIFERCGLETKVVEADTGAIGGSSSHEVVVLADTGEGEIAFCDACNYSANLEMAAARQSSSQKKNSVKSKFKEVKTPGLKTVEEVANFLKVKPSQMIKTLVYLRDDGLVAALIAGDLEINEVKLKNACGAQFLTLADAKTIRELTGAEVGFAGPVGLKRKTSLGSVQVFADFSVEGISDGVTGANKTDVHLTGVAAGVDFEPDQFLDLRLVKQGDLCYCCDKGILQIKRGIEVGHIFKLGTKYSKAMNANFLDESGKSHPIIMGTYGIGIGRTAASAIEQNHDDKGIIWPLPIAPFQVEVISLNQDEQVIQAAQKIYDDLQNQGIEVLYDDRDERAGVKFADADLIGIPYFIVVGSRGLKDNSVELKTRKTGAIEKIPLDQITLSINKLLSLPPS
ncbi:MAG: proline--tRNA ligase [Deltaproteobacteria bacterium]|nr:proline--tRNA ligase [Deltaproteobacteria bacterium]